MRNNRTSSCGLVAGGGRLELLEAEADADTDDVAVVVSAAVAL